MNNEKIRNKYNFKNEKLKKEMYGKQLEAFERYIPNPTKLGQGCINLCGGKCSARKSLFRLHFRLFTI